MGLDVVVGWLAQSRQELSDEEFQPIFEPFLAPNEVLVEAGQPPHHEPLEIANGDVFEAQMWGYNGLHMVRRLAAHWAKEGGLPPPIAHANVDQIPYLDELYAQHNAYIAATERRGLLSRFVKPKAAPPFAHLLLHSDCEGFYLPRRLEKVIFDRSSAPMLREECHLLASLIDLPEGLTTQDEQLWDFADNPAQAGPLWQQYGAEAYCLTALMRAAEASARSGAAVAFV